MNFFLVGASGRTGGAFRRLALARGHGVTAFARTPAKLAPHPQLRVVGGDVRDADALARAMADAGPCDAVVSCLGAARSQEARDVVSVGGLNVLAAMRSSGVTRLALVTVAGLLQWDEAHLRREAPGYPEVFRQGSAEHLKVYEALRASSLDWTLFCAPELVPDEPAGPLRVEVDHLPEGPKRVRIESLARLMLDALEAGSYRRQRVGMLDADAAGK